MSVASITNTYNGINFNTYEVVITNWQTGATATVYFGSYFVGNLLMSVSASNGSMIGGASATFGQNQNQSHIVYGFADSVNIYFPSTIYEMVFQYNGTGTSQVNGYITFNLLFLGKGRCDPENPLTVTMSS